MGKKRLNQTELSDIKEFIKKGKSLNDIAKLTGKSKTTIYYYFRRFKGKTVNPIKVLSDDGELIGEFIGLFAGDGCSDKTPNYQYRTYIYFNITERSMATAITEKVLKKIFGKMPMQYTRENRFILCYYSKQIHHLIDKYLIWNKNFHKTYFVHLKHNDHQKEFKIGFLRGSLDSDGYFSDKKIAFATVSEGLMHNIDQFLTDLQIDHSVRRYEERRQNRKDIYHIDVLRRSHQHFIQLVRPRKLGLYAPAGIRISER